VVQLTLIIAVVNMTLGFALALHLGYGPPGWREACRQWIVARWSRFRPGRDAAADPLPPPKELPSENPIPLKQLLSAEKEEALESNDALESSDELDDKDLTKLLNPDTSEQWDSNEESIETSPEESNLAAMQVAGEERTAE